MAEIVYKKVSELDSASQPLAGTEVTMVSQLGASKKVALTNLYGTGWFAKLIAAFSAFKAPDADHADNADTLGVGEEEPSDFHDAAQLTGNIHLDRIPAELTGKNAESVGGIDPVNGKAGSYDTITINASSVWIIPKGLYVLSINEEPNTIYLQVKNNSSDWWGYGFAGGMILSDGINFRLNNSNTHSTIVAFRKLS